MGRILLTTICFFVLVSGLFSCYSYVPIRLSKKVVIRQNVQKSFPAELNADRKTEEITGNLKDGKNRQEKKRTYEFFLKRYFVKLSSFSQLEKINNKGVDYSLQGKFKEAELYFKEVLKEDDLFSAAYNNLGIIYEIMGNSSMSFRMYSKACLLDPENDYYRRNFLYSTKKRK